MQYLVVAFFTKNTPYEEEAKTLIQSLEKHHIPMDIVSIKNQGNWQVNNHYKPYFLKQMLIKHFPKDILYLDVDAVVIQYPELFDNVDSVNFDIGVVYRLGKELLASMIYLKNNSMCYKLLVRWINTCLQNPTIWDQTILAEILQNKFNDLPLVIRKFPETYCQIYDLMSDVGSPVIQQNQASRRYIDMVQVHEKDIDPAKIWMSDQKLYKSNLQLLAARDPVTAKKIEYGYFTQIQPCITKKSEPNILRINNGKTEYYHSQEGALEEAEEMVKNINLTNVGIIFFYGLGLGYFLHAVGKWLLDDRTRKLVIIEDDLEVYYYFLHSFRVSHFFFMAKNILIFLDREKENVLKQAYTQAKDMGLNPLFLTLPYYRIHKKTEMERLQNTVFN